ncbi:MAG TPA: hypothetical protein VMI53_08560 [Opitutaceae bacterium]|nr:hypothetical protein [Opitutaceae bacterium]
MKNNRLETMASETPQQLLELLRQLVSETEQLLAEAGEHAEEKMEDLRVRIHHAGELLREFRHSTRQKIVAGARRADETIRSHPYESLAVTLGLGVLLGALLRRSNHHRP